MTFTPSQAGLRKEENFFRVGNFALYSHRSCFDAKAHFGLSQRETELVMLVGAGHTKREIAKRMGVTAATADTFRRRAYTKLGVNSGTAAVAIMTAYLAGSRVEECELEALD